MANDGLEVDPETLRRWQSSDAQATVMPPIAEGPGTVIGRYTLLQMIGDGGFGVVFMAEQKEPVRRRVPLKNIKLGMDTQQLVARFEAERQALAMMDHPNIAKVLEGGCTGSAESQIPQRRPHFVMELVKGQTVTKYCDEHKLSTRLRLELFIPICQAIQHAHQKGIIHRDIKPSNYSVGRPATRGRTHSIGENAVMLRMTSILLRGICETTRRQNSTRCRQRLNSRNEFGRERPQRGAATK